MEGGLRGASSTVDNRFLTSVGQVHSPLGMREEDEEFAGWCMGIHGKE